MRNTHYLSQNNGMRLVALVFSAYLSAICFAQKTLTVFAAASLKDAFTQIGKAFEAKEGIKIIFNFAGSQQLAAQINAGAPADVFASAAQTNFAQVKTTKGSSHVFAQNRLVVVLKPGFKLASFGDLNKVKSLVIAAPKVPAGSYARQMLELAGKKLDSEWKKSVLSKIVSEEQDVRSVLTKVELGEADAGIVYVSDARMSKKAVGKLAIPMEFNPAVSYPIGIVASSQKPNSSKRFIAFLMSNPAQKILLKNGFIPIKKEVE